MAYRIVLTNLDTGETIHDNETNAVVVVFDNYDGTMTRSRHVITDRNTLANLAERLLVAYNDVLGLLPKDFRKFVKKHIRKEVKAHLKAAR